MKISNHHTKWLTPLESCDRDNFFEPGFDVSIYFDLGARIFSTQRPPYDAHILQGLIYDCRQCFDSLWHEEVINNIFDAGVSNDKLALLYKINSINNLAVKTQHGLTERRTVKNIICQGDPCGSMQCSVQIDTIGRESLKAGLEPFRYKNKVEIPALGMVDDILTISKS